MPKMCKLKRHIRSAVREFVFFGQFESARVMILRLYMILYDLLLVRTQYDWLLASVCPSVCLCIVAKQHPMQKCLNK